jgi:methylmalonyl-CoA mutase
MPDEILSVAADFPPVPTADWDAAIRADLKGAEYDKKLVWRTEEGLAARPYYRAEDIASAPPFPHRNVDHTWEIAEKIPEGPDVVRVDRLHAEGAHAVQELAGAKVLGLGRTDLQYVFAIGPYYFIEIAKFRAARLLLPPGRIVGITPLRNKSVCDRYTNLLRVTTEAMSAVLGGCDTVVIQPFGFDPRLAVNVQRILKEEVHLDAVADVAGGSYYLEALTAMLVQEVEKVRGEIDPAIAQTRAAREKAVSSRRRTLVGVNNYPNLAEKAPEFTAPADGRLAAPFEKIRERTAAMAHTPRVLLFTRGDLKMRMARANFCLNFFGCAGFEIAQSEDLGEADLVVLCSSDPEYLALAREVIPQTKALVIVAGQPKDQIEALQAAGVQGFVHIQSDAVQTLTWSQERIAERSRQ